MKLEFHHINFVSKNVDGLHDFYTNVLGMDNMPQEDFPRTEETENGGYSGQIRFATEGKMQMHLAERDLDVAFNNDQVINPVDRGHMLFAQTTCLLYSKFLMIKVFPIRTTEPLLRKTGIRYFFWTRKEM